MEKPLLLQPRSLVSPYIQNDPPNRQGPRIFDSSQPSSSKTLPILEVSSLGTLINSLNTTVASDLNSNEPHSMANMAPQPWSNQQAPAWTTKLRPLSDIRELTEPSLIDNASHDRNNVNTNSSSLKRENSVPRKGPLKQNPNILARKGSQHSTRGDRNGTSDRFKRPSGMNSGSIISPDSQTDLSSTYSVSLENVPRRSPSRSRADLRERGTPHLRPNETPTRPHPLAYTVPNRGISNSPVRELVSDIGRLRLEHDRYSRSRTMIRTHDPNTDILQFPTHRHPRMSAELHLGANLFVGGGSIEGHVRIIVNEIERARHKRQLAINRISIDLLGVEEVTGPKRGVFLNLTTELIDFQNPPPHQMVESLKQISPIDPFWLLIPSTSNLPFLLSLPLDVGPPTFSSRYARIRYVLSVTLLIRDQGKQYLVRTSQDISVISVYDPEKALMSLPSPLTVSDEYFYHRDCPAESVKVTAGLHRQVWVSGTNIFVDIRIANNYKKSIKRLELQLERDILCYKHAAASTLEKTATQSRVFDFNERTVLTKNVLKVPTTAGWTGVPGLSTDLRTFDLELPRGQATVKCGKFFEVRYFLNIIIGTSSKPKLVTLQLPIVLIHMNSLDIVPNSVAQVAAAIEEKRARSRHNRAPSTNSHRRNLSSASRVQGRAFAAPRKQSQDRIRAELKELRRPEAVLNSSPRKYRHSPSRLQPPQIPRLSNSPQSPLVPPKKAYIPSTAPTVTQAYAPPPRFHIPIRSRSHEFDDYTYRTTSPSPATATQLHTIQPPHPAPAPPPQAKTRAAAQEETRQHHLYRMRSVNSLINRHQPPPLPPPPPAKDVPAFHELGLDADPPASVPTNPGEPRAIDGGGGTSGLGLLPSFRRMKSMDRWRPGGGGGWFADRSRERDEREREREKEKEKEREYRARGFGTWI